MICKFCGESFELRIGKPGYVNVCEDCGTPEVIPIPRQELPVRKRKRSLAGLTVDLVKAVESIDGKPDYTLRSLAAQLIISTSALKGGTK